MRASARNPGIDAFQRGGRRHVPESHHCVCLLFDHGGQVKILNAATLLQAHRHILRGIHGVLFLAAASIVDERAPVLPSRPVVYSPADDKADGVHYRWDRRNLRESSLAPVDEYNFYERTDRLEALGSIGEERMALGSDEWEMRAPEPTAWEAATSSRRPSPFADSETQ